MPIQWNLSLATGVRQIDLQHQELIDIINDLEAAHLAGQSERALQELLPKLSTYVLFHFGTEEAMMRGRSDCDAHAQQHVVEHRIFAERVAALKEHGDKDEALGPFVEYLKSWLVSHILETDRGLANVILGVQPGN